MIKVKQDVDPNDIVNHGIDVVVDRYIFRAIVIEAIRAAGGYVDPDILENELNTALNSIIKE